MAFKQISFHRPHFFTWFFSLCCLCFRRCEWWLNGELFFFLLCAQWSFWMRWKKTMVLSIRRFFFACFMNFYFPVMRTYLLRYFCFEGTHFYLWIQNICFKHNFEFYILTSLVFKISSICSTIYIETWKLQVSTWHYWSTFYLLR